MPVTPGVAAPSGYGFQCVLPRQDFTQAVTKVTEALKTEGFGILTEIDVQATMKATSPVSWTRPALLVLLRVCSSRSRVGCCRP